MVQSANAVRTVFVEVGLYGITQGYRIARALVENIFYIAVINQVKIQLRIGDVVFLYGYVTTNS